MIPAGQPQFDADMPNGGGAQHRLLACSDAPGSRDREYWVYAPEPKEMATHTNLL
jgi:hypothetical protein